MFENIFNGIFGGFITSYPALTIVIVSFLTSLIITLIYKAVTDQKLMEQLKKEQKEIQAEIKAAGEDTEKMMEINKRSMAIAGKMMKQSFKPMVYTTIPILILFTWMRTTFESSGALAFGLNWFWIYFISMMLFNMVIRKALKVH